MAKIKINPSTVAQQSDTVHGVYHLSNSVELLEIARSNNFEFVVTDLDNILKAGMSGNETNARISNAQEMLRLSVDSSSIPHFTQSPIEVKRGNGTLKFAGTPTWDNHEIRCIDFIGMETKEILMAWQNLSYNVDTEKVGLVTDYKKDCYLLEYSPDYQLLRKWKLYGCWVSRISEGNFSADDGNKRNIQVTIPYDIAKIDTSEEI